MVHGSLCATRVVDEAPQTSIKVKSMVAICAADETEVKP